MAKKGRKGAQKRREAIAAILSDKIAAHGNAAIKRFKREYFKGIKSYADLTNASKKERKLKGGK